MRVSGVEIEISLHDRTAAPRLVDDIDRRFDEVSILNDFLQRARRTIDTPSG